MNLGEVVPITHNSLMKSVVLVWRETIWLKIRLSAHIFLSTLLTAQSQILISDNTEKLTIEENCVPSLIVSKELCHVAL